MRASFIQPVARARADKCSSGRPQASYSIAIVDCYRTMMKVAVLLLALAATASACSTVYTHDRAGSTGRSLQVSTGNVDATNDIKGLTKATLRVITGIAELRGCVAHTPSSGRNKRVGMQRRAATGPRSVSGGVRCAQAVFLAALPSLKAIVEARSAACASPGHRIARRQHISTVCARSRCARSRRRLALRTLQLSPLTRCCAALLQEAARAACPYSHGGHRLACSG